MTWTKLGDDFTDDPALLALPRSVRLVHIEAMVWSNRHGTDGSVPAHALRRVTDDPDPDAAAEHLVARGKWRTVEGGWEIVGFLDDQPAAEDVQRTKELARARQRRLRQHRNGDHSLCDPQYCKALSRVTQRVTSRVTNGVSHDTPTRPDPTRPGPKVPRTGSGAAGAASCLHWDRGRDRARLTTDGDCLDCDLTHLCPLCVRLSRHGPPVLCDEHRPPTSTTPTPLETPPTPLEPVAAVAAGPG